MAKPEITGVLRPCPEGVRVQVKVVPGASRTRVAGVLGDRLKVQVAAPPEGGRANEAVCALLAEVLGVGRRGVMIESGHTQPLKTLVVTGISASAAHQALTELLDR